MTEISDIKELIHKTPRKDIIEEIHGEKVVDPYRWLENTRSIEVKEWFEAQNKFARFILDNLEGRELIQNRLRELLSFKASDVPIIRKKRYFFESRKGLEGRPVLCVREGLKDKEKTLVDPNTLNENAVLTLDWWYPSSDGGFIAYGISRDGDEWSTLYVLDVDQSTLLEDQIPRTRYCSLAWLPDNSGFYYTRYPEPGTVEEGQENYNSHVFFHKIGTNYSKDPKIFGEGRDPKEIYRLAISSDGYYLQIIVSKYSKMEHYLVNLKESPNLFVPVLVGTDSISFGVFYKEYLYILTNLNAPNRTIYRTLLKTPEYSNWELIIPEGPDLIQYFKIIGDKLFILESHNATNLVKAYSLTGEFEKVLPLPKRMAVQAMSPDKQLAGETSGSELFIKLESFTTPPTVYRYDLKTDSVEIFDDPELSLNSEELKTDQIWYTSKDGTRVSMFIIHKKGLKLDGTNPTLLTGYGGFNNIFSPFFKHRNLAAVYFWIENGGVFAAANLRGGGEYGEEWHKAGMLGKKQNVFDDFIAAAEWLIDQKYCSKETLGILGRSNGGLLVGAALVQRPDLFEAVYCAVPLLDMVRYHQFLIAKYWIPEYGSSEEPEQFKWLYDYSPYHHVKKGTKYPATFFITALSDTRVAALHAMKMTAAVQWANASENPVFLVTETRTGHGVAKSINDLIEGAVDVYAFFYWKLGLRLIE
ncbi:MAG: prolyl oligopeptidase family protein [Candidatus Hermodarchaeota archaeon]